MWNTWDISILWIYWAVSEEGVKRASNETNVLRYYFIVKVLRSLYRRFRRQPLEFPIRTEMDIWTYGRFLQIWKYIKKDISIRPLQCTWTQFVHEWCKTHTILFVAYDNPRHVAKSRRGRPSSVRGLNTGQTWMETWQKLVIQWLHYQFLCSVHAWQVGSQLNEEEHNHVYIVWDVFGFCS